MRFAVPQFIDVEDKIIGPLTLKQGIYLVGAGGAAYFFWALFGFLGLVFLGGPLVFAAILFAFVRINNRPFTSIASAAFFYAIKKKLYLWKKEDAVAKKPASQSTTAQMKQQQSVSPTVTQSKLRALAFSLDTEEGYTPEDV